MKVLDFVTIRFVEIVCSHLTPTNRASVEEPCLIFRGFVPALAVVVVALGADRFVVSEVSGIRLLVVELVRCRDVSSFRQSEPFLFVCILHLRNRKIVVADTFLDYYCRKFHRVAM